MAECMKNGVTCPCFYKCTQEGLQPSGRGWETIEVDGEKVVRARPGQSMNKKRTMQIFSFYCLAKPSGKKIGTVASWTGSTPPWCPRGRG